MLAETQQVHRTAIEAEFEFQMNAAAPTLAFRVQRSPDLTAGSWTTVATKTGAGPWSGIAGVGTET